ncbi:MAG TPA: acyl transferase [Vicinamibacteria bacterium]|nr:acyl transferase [Vicinamibacteria bacterium]
MRDASSPEIAAPPAVDLKAARRAALLVLGYLPLLHVLLVAACAALLPVTGAMRALLALASLYLMPPLAARLGARLVPLPRGRVDLDDPGFLAWWLSAQWQVVFNRLPALEEALRLVPGAYSAWLRLWGSRVGALVYWSPGVVVLDRGLVEVGDRVVFGAGVRINSHALLTRNGRGCLVVAPIRIGRGAMVGGHSLLTPGVEIAEGAASPPFRLVKVVGAARG